MDKKLNNNGVKDQQRSDSEDRQAAYNRWRASQATLPKAVPGICIEWQGFGAKTRPVGLILAFDVQDQQAATSTFAGLDYEIRMLAAMAAKLDCPAHILFALPGCQNFMASGDLRNQPVGQLDNLGAQDIASLLANLRSPPISNHIRDATKATDNYRLWHRKLASGMVMTDIDIVEVRSGTPMEVAALVDITLIKGDQAISESYLKQITERYAVRDQQGRLISVLAKILEVPAVVILYRENLSEFRMFGICNTRKNNAWVTMSEQTLLRQLGSFCKIPRAPEQG